MLQLISLIDSNSQQLHRVCIIIVISYALFGWLTLTGIKINYGRLSNSFVKIYINPKIAWFIFEVPNLLWACYFLFIKLTPLSFGYLLFILHYINRDIIYPLSLKTTTSVPFQIALNAFIFTFANGYLQGISNVHNLIQSNPTNIAIGTIIFAIGMAINIYSDSILQDVKEKNIKDMKEEENQQNNKENQQNNKQNQQNNKVNNKKSKKYVRIDKFLFKYVANPNYLGEIIQWIGYAIVCNNYQALLFAFSTLNILTPAAMVRSKWNHQNIQNYPKQRKAIFPFLL